MKLTLDACVLFPTVLREILIGCAKAEYYTPVWSPRILEEWARAAAKNGPQDEAFARGEIAVIKGDFPVAEVAPRDADMTRLWLPDENDIHVLATAIASSSDGIVTFNAKDFPRGTLLEEGVQRFDPDNLLMDFWLDRSDPIANAVSTVHRKAQAALGDDLTLRGMLKRSRLPRLGKALDQAGV